jgi:hypothetical protein
MRFGKCHTYRSVSIPNLPRQNSMAIIAPAIIKTFQLIFIGVYSIYSKA